MPDNTSSSPVNHYKHIHRLGITLVIGILASVLSPLNHAATEIESLQLAQNTIGGGKSVRIIEPEKDVPIAKAAAIDDEKFQIGVFTGFLAAEEFNTNPVLGASLVYHINDRWIGQLNYGSSDVDKATFEGDNNFLTDSQREFSYTALLAGYRILKGRSFWGKKDKFNSDLYLLAGLGRVDFGRTKSNTSFVIATSYRVVLTDSLVANLDFRGHSVDGIEISENEDQNTFNTELVFGLNFLF